jgi:hypothetical protein
VLERFAGRATVSVTGMIVVEVLARESTVSALGFVERWDVRLYPAVMDEPVQHLGRAVGAVPNQPGGAETEALH